MRAAHDNARWLAHGGEGEGEARLMPALCRRDRLSVDVGANIGGYALLMRRHSARVAAFEANPVLAARLRRLARLHPSIRVHGVALSSRAGTHTLRIPDDHGRSTLESANDLGGRPARAVEVALRRLDDLALGPVGCIKIDVEGHELAVLEGAAATLRASRPALLIEAAEEHRPDAVGSVARFLAPLGYHGLYLAAGRLHDLDALDTADPVPQNFAFVPDPAGFRAAAAPLLAVR